MERLSIGRGVEVSGIHGREPPRECRQSVAVALAKPIEFSTLSTPSVGLTIQIYDINALKSIGFPAFREHIRASIRVEKSNSET